MSPTPEPGRLRRTSGNTGHSAATGHAAVPGDAERLEDRRLRAIVRVSELEFEDLGGLLGVLLQEALELTGSTGGCIALCQGDADEIVPAARSNGTSKAAPGRPCAEACPPERIQLCRTSAGSQQPILAEEPARFMTVPVVSRGRLVALAGVSGKPAPYTGVDASQLGQMMDVAWKIAERQRAEDGLRELAGVLEARVDERTREIETANAHLETANAELQALLREQERLQAELAYRALHDPLTGLANRTMFAERLDHAIRRTDRGVAVLWIDLDRFKSVNDIFGHDVGDELLVAIAERLRDVVRETDDIARMGGDEFAVVLPNVSEGEARIVAERVLTALTDRDAIRLQVGASVGVGWQRAGGDGPALVRRADEAMYRAKAAGGGAVVLY